MANANRWFSRAIQRASADMLMRLDMAARESGSNKCFISGLYLLVCWPVGFQSLARIAAHSNEGLLQPLVFVQK